ncbi:MAG: helix-turn-helix domain-containing protein [Polaromonas sp.]|uniref:helix-turn-helix domain-containing protein n=1 Tax=Polaromonas sp. TaxID=1869339 RepID=UPI002734BBAE|nr:helix-turn-helix domain-containing protein [Polaromonas sp.]MDP2820477.1 helix-turn-helix domain-containing protein [Polaromonas sp.]
MEMNLNPPPLPFFSGVRPQVLTLRASNIEMQAGPDSTQSRPFKLLMQMSGHMDITQHGRHARIGAGQFTLVDGALPFNLCMEEPGEQVVVALPRQGLLSRHGGLRRQTARVHGERPEEALLADFLQALAARSAALSETGVALAAGAVLALLGGLAQPHPYDSRAALRDRALALIDLDIANVTAESLASSLRVSRRHLDGAFAQTGKTLGQYLWERRLTLAAERLRDASALPVTQIAHAVGFKDSSHFSRAFRQQFGLTPSRWRSPR